MKMINVKFTTVDEIVEFVKQAKNYNGELELKSGTYYVDAKSLLGVMNIGTQKEICLLMDGDDAYNFLPKIQFAVA